MNNPKLRAAFAEIKVMLERKEITPQEAERQRKEANE